MSRCDQTAQHGYGTIAPGRGRTWRIRPKAVDSGIGCDPSGMLQSSRGLTSAIKYLVEAQKLADYAEVVRESEATGTTAANLGLGFDSEDPAALGVLKDIIDIFFRFGMSMSGDEELAPPRVALPP